MGFEVAVAVHTNMKNKNKATAANTTIDRGKFCWDNISDRGREAGKGGKL